MAIWVSVPAGGRRAAAPRSGFFGRLLVGIAKPFNTMSINGALRSAQAEEFRLSCPAGEDNWKSRQTFMQLLTEACERTPASEIPAGFATTLEPYYNNIIDSAICERTTLSNTACRLLGVLPKVLGKDIVPLLDRFLPVLIRQCANTKTVAQKSASAAITNIITVAPYSARTLWHVCQTFEDKYSAPKLYAPGWLKLIIQNFHPALNPDRDYEAITKAILSGLEEADNNVRVNTRAVFWEYHKIDKMGAVSIISKLNTHARTALLNDPNNPDKSSKTTKTKVKKPEPDTSLAQIRQQAKDRLKQQTKQTQEAPAAPTVSAAPAATVTLVEDHTKASSRPLLSAPVRRPRIVATPINRPQPKSGAPPIMKAPKADGPALIPGEYQALGRRGPDAPLAPSKAIEIRDDGLSVNQRLDHQAIDSALKDMEVELDQEPILVDMLGAREMILGQTFDEKHTQGYLAHPDLRSDGDLQSARDALDKALQYLNKDALDDLGFRKLRKLLEQYGSDLIEDQAVYDLLITEILSRFGNIEELLKPEAHESRNSNHPRYIHSALATMTEILICSYPVDWSYQYVGPALASILIATCSYSVNAQPFQREANPTYYNKMTIVNQLATLSKAIPDLCINPLEVIDSIVEIIYNAEQFLMAEAPLDSEHQTPRTWASFNPYSKENRLNHLGRSPLNLPDNLSHLVTSDPAPLPTKMPLLMENGLLILQNLLVRVVASHQTLGRDREDSLANLCRHLLNSYSIIIRKQVMEFCQVLYQAFESDGRFWTLFPDESDRNLLHYYMEKVR